MNNGLGGRIQMSRKAGTPNKPKVEIPTGYKDDKFDLSSIPVTTLNDEKFIQTDEKLPYRVTTGKTDNEIIDHVNWWIQHGYECQGGVSVTNYRANDGRIEFVYCQAMIRKEM